MSAIAIVIANQLPAPLRQRALFHIGVSSTPMMRHVRPRLVELTDDRATVRIEVSRRTRNAFNTLFFGALATGADCVAGLFAMKFMLDTGHRTLPLVKTANTDCLKKVSRYAHFTCDQGSEVFDACRQALTTGARQEVEIRVLVTAPEEFGEDPVARITQVMSIRVAR